MSGLVGYHYDDSDEETRRNSISKDDSSPKLQSIKPAEVSDPPEAMDVDDKELSPEIQIIGEVRENSEQQPGSPLPAKTLGYFEQMRQEHSPVPCSEEMLQKYQMLFTKKSNGISMDKYLDDIKSFKNPSLYDLLLEKFDIETHGSNLPRSTKLFDLNEFTENDFYDRLACQQNPETTSHRSKSSKNHH